MIPVKFSQVVKYGGHSLAPSGSVNLTFKADYSELVKTIQLNQLLNNDVTVKARIPGTDTKLMLGVFRISSLKTDGDGSSTIKLCGLNTFVEMDSLNLLPTKQDDTEYFVVRYESEIEEEEGEEDEQG